MNDVPLIRKTDVNDINTSLIAIKKQLKQLNEAVGLIDVPDVDLTPFVRKDEVVNVIEAGNMNPVTSNAVVPTNEVTSGNMHPVTSNAVASALSPNWSGKVLKLSAYGSFTVTENGFISADIRFGGTGSVIVYVNQVPVIAGDAISGHSNGYACGFASVSVGDIVSWSQGANVSVYSNQGHVYFIPHK